MIYDAIASCVMRAVQTRGGDRRLQRRQVFTQNGGSLSYEALPWALDGGLVEGGTPECRGPDQLLVYQRAQDRLLKEAAEEATELLAAQGFPGELGLLKNCRDAEGNVYGAQENYSVVATPKWHHRWLYRGGLGLLIPIVAATVLMTWTVLLAFTVVALGLLIGVSLLSAFIPPLRRILAKQGLDPATFDELGPMKRGQRPFERHLGRVAYGVELVLWSPLMSLFSWVVATTCFRPQRRALMAYLASRQIFTGAGTLLPDGSFALSEKAPSIVRTIRLTPLSVDRAVFDTGNLLKHLSEPTLLQVSKLFGLFRKRQRLQLGLSDSNVAQLSEYLKIGVTSLMMDLAEAGHLDDAPQLRKPIEALHAIARDPTLTVTVACLGGKAVSALQLQRWYCDRARSVLSDMTTVPMGAREMVRLWREALDGLEGHRSGLVGRIDWVTKRYLLETAGGDAPEAVLKKIDLRYHELGRGYLARLESAGKAPVMVAPEEVAAAVLFPPEDSPAQVRGRMVRELADSEAAATVSWDRIRVGGRFGGRVIRLSDYRDSRSDDPRHEPSDG